MNDIFGSAFDFNNFDAIGNAANVGFDMNPADISGGAYNTDFSGMFGDTLGGTQPGWMSSLMGSGEDKGWLEKLGPMALGAYGLYGQNQMNEFNKDMQMEKLNLMKKDDKRYNEYLDSWAGAFGGASAPASPNPSANTANTGMASAFAQPTKPTI